MGFINAFKNLMGFDNEPTTEAEIKTARVDDGMIEMKSNLDLQFVDDIDAIATNINVYEHYQDLPIEDRKAISSYVSDLIDHFIRHENKYFIGDRNKVDSDSDDEDDEAFEEQKKKILEKVDRQLVEKNIPLKYRDYVKEQFIRYRWGYYILDPLIADPNISDIKLYDYDHITVKKIDKRYDTNFSFIDRRDYRDFVSLIAVKNGMGQSNNNAIIKFTDVDTSGEFRLRFDILTKYVTSSGLPFVHIRKHPKTKRSFEELKRVGEFPPGTIEYLLKRLADGQGFLVTGKNGSGKTTFINALIDKIGRQKSIMVIEDNQELFGEHKETLYTHSVETRAENKITYSLSDLAEEGLLCDQDVIIVGEIKNDSAKGLMKAAYVGVQCMTTSHGQSAIDGYYKLADYVKQATTYELTDCLRFLVGLNTLIFMKNYKIKQIVEIHGWDMNKMMPIFVTVFDEDKGGWKQTNA